MVLAPKASDRGLPTWVPKEDVAYCRLHGARADPTPPLLRKGFMCNTPTLLAVASSAADYKHALLFLDFF